ncbi:DUF4198 domain-containing protein [Spirosoma fluviale]|uniref:Uncharacterized conserved protein, contains GH25 family domain n=1 Tax=Spirosoma fluviale TaxID=1597977 RepID=A0A286GRP2_9BACT|nr:DUF4198 domain-containing protein [Spirosoma fluviale]SOD97719.1 Uncharacterized conserved protein, contains GH25 family domain [Spirosoma fluviale]
MKRVFLFFSFSLFLIFLAHGHEFWLQPNTFFAEPGQLVPVEVLVGEHFQGERSEGKKNRIIQYVHWFGNTKEDIAPQLTEGHYGSVPVKLSTPGTHLIALANTNKYLEMRADSFLLYLKEDGLDPVIQWRKQHNQTRKRSREFYRRCVKTLIQVGPLTTNDQTYSRNTGMPLEIIPAQNPYRLKPGGSLQLTVLFQNKPLAGALVRYWNRPSSQQSAPSDFTEQQQQSDKNGQVRFAIKAGNNMVSLVQMVPYADTKQADWQSYWGSLTFGCR